MSSLRIAFRTEGNHKQGMGDVCGSVAMARECGRYSDEVTFLVAGDDEGLTAIRESGCQVALAPSLETEGQVLERFRPDVIIVNKLANSAEYISWLKQYARVVATVDDAGEGATASDLRINVLYHVSDAITDPRYIALREEFRDVHRRARTIRPQVRELLVTQGGSDTCGFTPKIVRALDAITIRPHVRVVLGPAFRHRAELDEVIRFSTLEVTVVHNARNMAELMWNADLAIAAGGLTMYELACVGTPAIVVCGEPFEVESAARLEQAGVVVNLQFGGDLDYRKVPKAVDRLARDLEARQRMSVTGKSLVDGRGCERTIKHIRQMVLSRLGKEC